MRYVQEAVQALASVTEELNATLEASFGAPRVVRYDAGYPCADV